MGGERGGGGVRERAEGEGAEEMGVRVCRSGVRARTRVFMYKCVRARILSSLTP